MLARKIKPFSVILSLLMPLASIIFLDADSALAAEPTTVTGNQIVYTNGITFPSKERCENYLAAIPGKDGVANKKMIENLGFSNVVCKDGKNRISGETEWRVYVNQPAKDPTAGDASWLYWLLAKLFGFIASIFKWILEIVFSGINWAFGKAFDIPMQLKSVWTALRDFINIVFALLTVGVAVMQILGIKTDTYAIKNSLPRLIAAIVLVNLSWIIGMLFLDLGNIAYHAVWNINPTSGTTPEIGALLDVKKLESVAYLDSTATASTTTFNMALWSAMGMVIYFLAITPCIQLFGVLLVRILVVWLLLAVAPLAWLGFVVPDVAAETWGKYWKALTTMIFLPARVALYFVIGIMTVTFYVQLEPGQKVMNTLTQDKTAGLSQYQKAVQAQADETARQNNSTAKPLDVVDAIIVLLIGVFVIRLAAKDAMKNEWTEGVVNMGAKLGGLAERGALGLGMAASKLPIRGIKAAVRHAPLIGTKAQERKQYAGKMADSATKAAESLRTAESSEHKASGVEAAMAKKRALGTLSGEQEQKLNAKLQDHRAKATEAREVATAHQEDARYFDQLRRGTLGSHGEASSQVKFIDRQIKANREALANGDTKDRLGRDRTDNITRLQARAAQINLHLSEHAKTGVGIGGEFGDIVQEVAKGAVKDVFQPSAIPLAAKKIYGEILGNINFNRDMDATKIAQRVGGFIDKGDKLGGVLESAGIDGTLGRTFQGEMDRKYAEVFAKKYEDLLKYGDTGALLGEIEMNSKAGDRGAMIANELLFNKLLEKAAFMSKNQVSVLQDWMKEVLAAEQKGVEEEKLMRSVFTQGFKDFGGMLRRDNPFFTNVRLSEHGLHGFGPYDLRKVTGKHLKDANFPDFIDEMTKLRKDGPDHVKGEIPAGIADVAYNLFAPARSDLSDGALKNLQDYVKSRFATQPNLQAEFRQIRADIDAIAQQMKQPGADINALQQQYRKQNSRLRNLWKAFEQMQG